MILRLSTGPDMRAPPTPDNEATRLRAVEQLDMVYTPAEERFDQITRIATRLFNVPIALVSLVTEDQQWFKSRQGLTAAETSRQISFCGHAILNSDIFVVPNALKDPDFRDNPLVTGPPNIRFYAGQPLRFEQMRIGTLCIIDRKPRQLRPRDYDSLRSLGSWVEMVLEDWRQAKSAFMQRVSALPHRETLLDPLTGNLNTKGMQLLQQRIGDEQFATRQYVVEYHLIQPDANRDEQLRLKIAEGLQASIEDGGIIGYLEPDRFQIMLSNQTGSDADQRVEVIRRALAQLQRSDRTSSPWSWQLSEDVSAETGVDHSL
jgi:hypothetical protein